LVALRIRGETPDIIVGAAKAMRSCSNQIKPKVNEIVCDTCGTGGDGANTFNISTIAALIAAGAGVKIAKHGNRSISSKCGSADLLEGFGVKIDLEPSKVEEIISRIGIGFMFAPKFHPAMKFAMPVRMKLGMRTIFNILGPLTNPADAKGHVLGVFNKDLVDVIAKVMLQLDAKKIYVVHSEPGVDEIVPTGNIYISEVKDKEIISKIYKPSDFKMRKCKIEDLRGGNLENNIKIAVEILTSKDKGIKRDVSIINAAHVLLASGKVDTFQEACELCNDSIETEKALKKLEQLIKETGGSIEVFNSVINRYI